MANNRMQEKIQSIIEDYLNDSCDISGMFSDSDTINIDISKAVDLQSEVIDHVDPAELANIIVQSIQDRILSYVQFNTCDKCKRPIGQWEANAGGILEENLVMKNGRNIIVIDDF